MPRLYSSLLLSLLIASSGSAFTMEWTFIGDPGNAGAQLTGCYHCDEMTFGAVPYTYSIGTYEVTNAQYAEFLNAKWASERPYQEVFNDPVYDPRMGDVTQFGGITRSGSDGSYTYSTIAGREDMPVNWVSFHDTLRFANWMNNGQGNGDTESGSYTLHGGDWYPDEFPVRSAGAAIVLPFEDEWFKAAYYDALTQSYFEYPTASDTPPTCTAPTSAPNSANCITDSEGDFTPVGSYSGSASPYGTYDQAWNAHEWTETSLTEFARHCRRGSAAATDRNTCGLYSSDGIVGFRVALVPEPDTGLLVIAGLLGLARCRRVRA
jgi:formylglycine-generating enzyme